MGGNSTMAYARRASFVLNEDGISQCFQQDGANPHYCAVVRT